MQEPVRFIEVVSEGEYFEEIEQYVADLRLEVHAATEETALAEMEGLKDKAIRLLREAGFTQEELFDGGTEVWRPWYARKKPGKQVWYKLTIRHKNMPLFSAAISSLEPLFSNQRHTFTLDRKQPVFLPQPGGLEAALRQAFDGARHKARVLAAAAGVALGGVLQMEELSKAKRNSGAFGDEDWGGDEARYGGGVGGMAVAGAPGGEPPEISNPKRTIWLRYRVRFEVVPNA
jgi:hypothetical protein